MHISEGILSAPVLVSGAVLAAAGTAVGLSKLDYDRIAPVGVMSAAFFVASLVHVPLGPSSVHLILNGVVGLLLGWGAFPAILVALLLQAVLFQFGGISALGVNTINVAVPAVLCYWAFTPLVQRGPIVSAVAAFAAGSLAVFLTSLMVALSLMFTDEGFFEVAGAVVAAHVPVMIIEGVVTMVCVGFLKKVEPGMLRGCTVAAQKME